MAVKCILTGQTPSVLDGVTENVQTQIDDKQPKITADGILKGDGNSNISAAVKGTDYDTEIGIVHYEDSFDSVEAAYNKSKRLFCSEYPKEGYFSTDSAKLYALLNRSQPYVTGGGVEIKYTFTCLDKTITLTREKQNSTATPVDTWEKGSQAFNPRLHASTHKTGGSDAIAPSDIGAQTKITANGILKGDGNGNITAADSIDLPIRAESIIIPKGRMRGDVDGDGKITHDDVQLMIDAGNDIISLTDIQTWCADTNGDGLFKAADKSILRQYINGLVTPLTSAPTFADYYNNWTYVKVDDLTGYWTTEISIADLTTSNNVVVNICETFPMGQFYKAEVSTGKVKIYATTPPITDIPATITISLGSGKGSIPSYLDDSSVQPEIFIATYGTTTSAEIEAAYRAGKIVLCKDDTMCYFFCGNLNTMLFTTALPDTGKKGAEGALYWVSPKASASGGWAKGWFKAHPNTHASTHASGGSDPITPVDIGAQPTISANGILKGDGSGNITAASETEVELVSLPNICNPNLLDNWYFGNPVDQRNGYVVPPQTPYFTLSATEWNQVGVTEGYYAITGTNSTGGAYTISIGGTTYMVTTNAAVRGYTGEGYTIDRWKLFVSGSVAITDGGLQFSSAVNFGQVLEGSRVPNGIKATASVLTDEGLASVTFSPSGEAQQIFSAVVGGTSLYFTCNWGGSGNHLIMLDGSGLVKAVKLELGSQQTLAHQENGAWVLNEIPDYREQLRRCQRYYQRLKASSGYMRFGISQPYTDTAAGVFIPLQVEMRTAPTMSSSGNFALFEGSALLGVNLQLDTASPYNVILNVTGTGLPGTSAQFLANADTNAYIEFSADL